jgi:putative transposase
MKTFPASPYRGQRIGLRRVERLMREHGIRTRNKRRFKATTDSKHSMLVAPNVRAKATRTAWRPGATPCGVAA